MPFKYLLFIISISFFTLSVSAQKQNVYFLKNDLTQVDTKDSADFIRVISEPDSGTKLYNIKEYYKNGKLKLAGKTSSYEFRNLQGQCVTFYPSGKRKQFGKYIDDVLDGDVVEYYPNGTLYTVKKYDVKLAKIDAYYTVKTCNDSTGKSLVTHGNGDYVYYNDDFKSVAEQGPLKLGMKTGEWTGTFSDTHDQYHELYFEGKLVLGWSIDSAGKKTTYNKRYVNPTFIGGEERFGLFLRQNVKYPARSREAGIAGKVVIAFVVEPDGSLTEFKILRTPNYELAGEALRVLMLSPKWNPGLRGGIPVKVQYTMPVNFFLSE